MSLGACRSSVAVPGSGDDTMRDTRAADAVERTERALDEFHAATARAGIAAHEVANLDSVARDVLSPDAESAIRVRGI